VPWLPNFRIANRGARPYPSSRAYSSSTTLSSSFLNSVAGSRSGCRDKGPTVAALLYVNAGGQHAILPVEGMLTEHHIDHLKAVRPRLDVPHFEAGYARV